MLDYKKELNEEQYNIVMKADGNCLVLAGAGSGKTRTLTYRVAYLLEKGVKAENILLMTFTNKAAHEMVDRVHDLLGYHPHTLWAGTFHRIGNKILRRYAESLGYNPYFVILDQQDSKTLLKNCVKELNIDTKQSGIPKVEVVRSMISYAQNTAQEIDDWLCVKYNFPSFILDKIIAISDLYKKRKKELNAMDFDDLLVRWWHLLRDFPSIKEDLAKQFQYILVDEYQDTNNIQARIIKELASVHKNVLAVGDDSQSIYSFRAADIGHILNFENNFEDTQIFKLQINYRSTPEILELANQSIAYNTKQYFKELKSVKEEGTKPIVMATPNIFKQADFIINRIKEVRANGKTLEDIAILFRAGHMSAQLQLELSKHNIPFVVRSGQKYFDQAHIKDLVAVLRLWQNIHDKLAWTRLNTLLPGIGAKTSDRMFEQWSKAATLGEALAMSIKVTPKQRSSWATLHAIFVYLNDLEQNSEDNTLDIADGLRFVYQSFYKEYLKKSYDNAQSRMDDVVAFINFAQPYTELEQLLTDITLDESATNQSPDAEEAKKLVLSTIHQAKGLEWDEVIVMDCRDGAFPHYKSKESLRELEEERRLFYVAVTRAKNKLTLLYPITVKSYEYGEMISDPSMFIQELDQDAYIQLPKHKSLLGNYGFSDDEPTGGTTSSRWRRGQNYFDEYDDSGDDSFFEDEVIVYE